MKKFYKILSIIMALFVVFSITALPAFAAGEVSQAVEGTWHSAAGEIKTIVNNVVFPIVDVILAVLLFVKIATAYMDYRKHGQLEWTAPAIIFFCLIFALAAPQFIWSIAGI